MAPKTKSPPARSAAAVAPVRPAYVDDPAVTETFVDTLERIHVDGQIIRLEFSVLRWEGDEGPGRRTACRVVLPAKGAVDLLNRMNQLQDVLVRAGALKVVEAGGKAN